MKEMSVGPTSVDSGSPEVARLLQRLNSPWKMRLFFLWKLPTLLFWGARVQRVSPQMAEVVLPFHWRSQNPFQSAYFAALCGAGELAGGLLALVALAGHTGVSMLVTGLEAQFYKKAVGPTWFVCSDGEAIQRTVQAALASGEGQTVRVVSVGRNKEGLEVCRITLTWSFRKRVG